MKLLTTSRVILQAGPEPWSDLVRQSADLLQRDGIITADYVEAIFASFARNGNYMVITPKVLLAHARPEEGALGTGLSLITTSEDVALGDDTSVPVRLFFTLAAADSSGHLDLLARLAEVLVDKASFQELLTTTDADRVLQMVNPN
jgi:mannitol/fructose-specific phosphotransferase system IIA component (Ntr-type)